MQNLQKNGSPTEGLGNRCIPISEISEMGNSREAASTSSGSDCTPQERLTTAFKESDLIESGECSTVRQSGPCDPVKKTASRRKWSKEDNLMLWRCYLLSEPGKRGYRQRLHKICLDNNGANVTEQRLCDQRTQIEKKGWLTDVEKEMIQRHILPHEPGASVSELEQDGGEQITIQPGIVQEEEEVSIDAVIPTELNNPSEEPNDEADLSPEDLAVLTRLREINLAVEKPIFNLKTFNKYDVMAKTTTVNKLLKYFSPQTITETRNLLQAASSLVGELLGAKKPTAKQKKEPWWKRRIEQDIVSLRKDLAVIESWFYGRWKNRSKSKMEFLNKKYHLKKLGFMNAIETIRQRISAKATKIKRYNNRCQQFQQNKLFQNDQTRFYRSLEDSNAENVSPNPEEATKFWSDLWSNPVEHREGLWLGELKEDLKTVVQQNNISINQEALQKQIRRTASWKSPGPDGLHGFWYKNFYSLHKTICSQLNQCLTDNSIPPWMTVGRTVLLMKDPAKGNEVGNYRPIACLNIIWKILTGVFSEKTYEHLNENNLLPVEQKGCRKSSRGTKDHLTIDKLVLKNCKKRLTNLCMSWIDFKKAYDMVPHSWITESMKLFGLAENLVKFMTSSMEHWSTDLFCNNSHLGNVKIRRGIFQGDSFSPMLFIIALIPLTLVLRKINMGYKLSKDGPMINHMFFMDDLKLFAKSENEIDSLVQSVQLCCKDIGMEFGISKCAVLAMKRGKKIHASNINLPTGESMSEPDASGYKYLGILEFDDILRSEMKSKVKTNYFKRLKLILKSKLNARNLFLGINSWVVATFRYSAAILDWNKNEIDEMDRKTRKLLTIYGAFHPKSSVNRLYMKRKDGGRGLISLRDCTDSEIRNIEEYIANSEEELFKYASTAMNLDPATIEEKEKFQKRLFSERSTKLKSMKLHGQFEKDTEAVKTKESWDWLRCGDLKRETEALIMAAQEQALNTNSIKKNIYKITDSDKCRLCGKNTESVTHIISACPKLAQKEYKRRHDKVCLNIHWALSKKYAFKCPNNWYEHVPERVMESEDVKILWDFSFQLDRKIDHYRPDIVLFDKKTRKCLIIDVAIPGDHRINVKETDKILAYGDLKLELSRMWNCETKVVPIIIGALGSIPANLEKHLKSLDINCNISTFQKSALLGTAGILRKVLSV